MFSPAAAIESGGRLLALLVGSSTWTHWLVDLWEWIEEHPIDAVFAGVLALIFAVFCAWGVEVLKKHWRFFEDEKITRGPRDVRAESLVDGIRLQDASGAELMRAINWGALDLISRATGSADSAEPGPLEAAWSDTSFADYSEDSASFIRPACRLAASGASPATTNEDALGVLIEWLRFPPKILHGEIRGDTGTGKTTLLHRTFVEMMESVSDAVPLVPMLASADNIYQNSDELERLKHEGNHLSAFVSVWLEKRRILAKSRKAQETLVQTIQNALQEGTIVLFIDGIDELRAKGAGAFVTGLLDSVRRWIVTRRYEDSAAEQPTGHVITLESAWNRERMVNYVSRRFANRPEVSARLRSVLGKLIPEKGTSSHWLSLPSNFRAYTDEVARPTETASEAVMYRLAESATGLMEKLFKRDMRNLEDADPGKLREALSTLALCKSGDPRARRDSPIGRKVAGMRTLLRSDGDSLVFRHAAEAEYFLAVRLGRELFDGPLNWSDAEALRSCLDHPWGTGRIRLVDEVLRDKAAAPERAEKIENWLVGASPVVVGVPPILAFCGKRNLIEVWKKTRSDNQFEPDSKVIRRMNLSEMDGRGLDLREERVEYTSFHKADLRDAEMMHAQFIHCQFDDADLRSANASGANFEQCTFGDGDQFAKVNEFEIEGIQINPPQLESKLIASGARSQLSRYRGKFGEQFLKAQKTFLGTGVDDLEANGYVPSIRQALKLAIQNSPGRSVYLVDLMAGGQGGRSEQLLSEFPQLQILSIDRDSPQCTLSERQHWFVCELSHQTLLDPLGTDPFGISGILLRQLAGSHGRADVVIAKKALHELDRRLQPALLKSCGSVLQPGGHLVLFVDAPGPDEGPLDDTAHAAAIALHEGLRTLLVDPKTLPNTVKSFLSTRPYSPNPIGEWLFINDWVAVKDWANSNLHELSNRYFASIVEICTWASPCFKDRVEITINHYDLNPLRFNERGVNYILHFLERHRLDLDAAITQHQTLLMERLGGSEKFRALVDFTRMVFDKNPAFALMMKARPCAVQLATMNPSLTRLEIAEVAPQFEMKCAVLCFERSPTKDC